MTVIDPLGPLDHRADGGTVPGRLAGSRRPGRRAALVLTLVGCLAVLAGLYLVAARTVVGQRIDDAAVLHHHLDRTPDADVGLSDHVLLLTSVLLVPLVVWSGRFDRRRLVVNGCAVAGSVLLAEVSREVLTRPLLGHGDPLYGASYPSGHAAAAMRLALAVVALSDGGWTRRLVSVIPGCVAAVALAVPIHRPSDLLAGFILAFAVMTAAQWIGPAPKRMLVARAAAVPWLTALGRSVLLASMLLVAEALALRRANLTLADLGVGFPIAVLAVVVAAELTVATFRRLLAAPTRERPPISTTSQASSSM